MNKGFLIAGALSALTLTVRPAAAQYYALPHTAPGQNPGGLNTDGEGRYDLGQPGWNLLLTGTAATQAQPAWTAVQTLPFAFSVGGQSFNSYIVSSSGGADLHDHSHGGAAHHQHGFARRAVTE